MSHSFYSCREPFDFEQSGWGLVERHLWSDRHQRGNNIPHGPWSWCIHRFKHQFGWFFPRLTTRTCFLKFVNLDLSIRCSLSNFRTPYAMVMTSLDYCNGLLGGKPREVSHQSVIWRVRKGTVPHWMDIPAKIAFRICELAHPCLCGSAPPYLIPHTSERHHWTHILPSQIGCRGHVKISRPGSQTLTIGSWEFGYIPPSAWNSLQVDLRDPGFSHITLRWKVNAFLFSLFICSSNALHCDHVCKLPAAFVFETIFNSFLMIIIIAILLLNK